MLVVKILQPIGNGRPRQYAINNMEKIAFKWGLPSFRLLYEMPQQNIRNTTTASNVRKKKQWRFCCYKAWFDVSSGNIFIYKSFPSCIVHNSLLKTRNYRLFRDRIENHLVSLCMFEIINKLSFTCFLEKVSAVGRSTITKERQTEQLLKDHTHRDIIVNLL